MADREKVVKGLEHCSKDGCKGCPYEQDCKMCYGFSGDLVRDALELLKEQESRVLTWDEVKRAEVCWVEERGKEPYADIHAAEWNPDYYGKEIRCWNYKPTKEQMEAVKWDD